MGDGVCVFGGSEEKRRNKPPRACETGAGTAFVQELEVEEGVVVPEEDDVEGCCWWSCDDLGIMVGGGYLGVWTI